MNQAQQKVLRADEVVTEQPSLLLGEDQDSSGSISEASNMAVPGPPPYTRRARNNTDAALRSALPSVADLMWPMKKPVSLSSPAG